MSTVKSRRIVSMDQFRGYTVAGMFLVNFVGGFAAFHSVLKHNNNYFSYADSIMPSFMFAVGFSFRLTYLRRQQQLGWARTVWTYVRRSLVLVGVSLLLSGLDGAFRHWRDFEPMPREFQPFRAKAPRTQSFDFILTKVKESNPALDEPSAIKAASRIGTRLTEPEPRSQRRKAEYAIAQQAAQIAEAEGKDYIGPAVERRKTWEAYGSGQKLLVHWGILVGKILKSDLWETLAIIGVTQLVVMPWIGCGFGVRFLVLVGLGVVDLLFAGWFNWDFVYGLNDNWLSKLFMAGDSRSWDGGFFGPLSWGIAMMGGTLAYDLVALSATRARASAKLVGWGVAFMVVGYAMSCLTRLYDLTGDHLVEVRNRQVRRDAEQAWLGRLIERQQRQIPQRSRGSGDGRQASSQPNASSGQPNSDPDHVAGAIAVLEDQERYYPSPELAENPVLPSWQRLKGRSLFDLLAEPPFVAPPPADSRVPPSASVTPRLQNYWMMGKRMPSLSFMTFSTGFAFALYGLFVYACDLGGVTVGVFRTLGTNALLAYCLHEIIEMIMKPYVPRDSSLWRCLAAFALFFAITYLIVRILEWRKIYLKL